jgi:hypothetical protein
MGQISQCQTILLNINIVQAVLQICNFYFEQFIHGYDHICSMPKLLNISYRPCLQYTFSSQ